MIDTQYIDFDNTVNFLGRNGYFMCTGLLITPFDFKDCIDIGPITSKGVIGRCAIQVPYENIPELIEKLQLIYSECGR